MRKMAHVVRIDSIVRHENSDFLSIASVGGWRCVIRTGDFHPGELAAYCEIDSWLPEDIAVKTLKLEATELKKYKGRTGCRLRSVKIRGVLSQGLLLPLPDRCAGNCREGDDLSDTLGIVKWEPEDEGTDGAGQTPRAVMPGIPSLVPDTDAERIQNFNEADWKRLAKLSWTVTEKLDGTAATYFLDGDGVFHACSHRHDVSRADFRSLVWQDMARKGNIEAFMRREDLRGIALQGEICGPGIQGNRLHLKEKRLYLFAAQDTSTGKYGDYEVLANFARDMNASCVGIVPLVAKMFTLPAEKTCEKLLEMSCGLSVISQETEREGLCFRSGPDIFKAINNRYLLRRGA